MKTRRKAQEPAKSGKRTIDMNLLDLYSSCLKNASELFDEAELLLNNGHHARAYFLGYTAIEELGKAQVVADFFYDLVTEAEFKAAFRDHKFKAAYLSRYVLIPKNPQDHWFIEYDAKSVAKETLERKRSLYIECLPDHSPQVPGKVITTESAKKLLAVGRNLLHEIIKMEHITERIGTKAFTK